MPTRTAQPHNRKLSKVDKHRAKNPNVHRTFKGIEKINIAAQKKGHPDHPSKTMIDTVLKRATAQDKALNKKRKARSSGRSMLTGR